MRKDTTKKNTYKREEKQARMRNGTHEITQEIGIKFKVKNKNVRKRYQVTDVEE